VPSVLTGLFSELRGYVRKVAGSPPEPLSPYRRAHELRPPGRRANQVVPCLLALRQLRQDELRRHRGLVHLAQRPTVQAGPSDGCSAFERTPGADDELGPPACLDAAQASGVRQFVAQVVPVAWAP
jgi:hypothetical protein